ncbi:hypothetical protein FO519_008625 [Halicephalobus sp. NKZ332]|nr:hypothetical protein FO519_008625 [Halicephalobus sp. NKZ332]
MAAGWKKFTGVSQYPELSSNSTNSSFCYGVKNDRKFRLPWIQGKRDLDVEREVISWIEVVTKKFAPPEKEIPEWLKDGVILCEILDNVLPNTLIRKINRKKSQFSSAENITNFLDSAKKAEIPDICLFELSDLLDEKDIGKVFKTLNYLRENVKFTIEIQRFS